MVLRYLKPSFSKVSSIVEATLRGDPLRDVFSAIPPSHGIQIILGTTAVRYILAGTIKQGRRIP